MVFRVLKFNLRAASCCKLLVVKGAAGLRRRSFFSTFVMLKSLPDRRSVTSFTSSAFFNLLFLPSRPQKFALNFFRAFLKFPLILQYSSCLLLRIYFSRSMINFKATDCTRPALNPFFSFLQRMVLIV